jgi:GMP synthase-like glutamine amidotransferase
MITENPEIKVAILDLYDGLPNIAIRSFEEILKRYKSKNRLNLSYQVFDVRSKCQAPGYRDFDIYISSGGPGDPLVSEGTPWEKVYFNLVDKLEDHNLSGRGQKKYAFFVCHSFQLMCRKYRLGEINTRNSPSFGVLPVLPTQAGLRDPLLAGLSDPFYALDSRSWQVICPDEKRFDQLGMQLLATEQESPQAGLPQAMMAIRFSEYFVTTQFHPEADAAGMINMLNLEEKKKEMTRDLGLEKYREMLKRLSEPDKIIHTQNTIIPNFLDEAVLSLQL